MAWPPMTIDPYTRVIPNLPTDQWGRTVALDPDATNFTKVFSLDGVSEGVTIATSMVPQTNVLTSSAVVRVVWQSGSGTQTVEADVGRGSVLSVNGTHVEVSLRNSSTSGTGLQVTAIAHRGLKPSLPAWRTLRTVTADGVDADHTIPNFAADVQVYRSDSTSQPMTVTLLGPSSSVLSTVYCAPGVQCPILRLPDLAVTARVNITNGASIASCVFGLRV